MNEEIEELRRQIADLATAQTKLLGYIGGLREVVSALIQTHPRHSDVNLALSLYQDARDAGRLAPLPLPAEAQVQATQVIEACLTLEPFAPGALQSQPGMTPR